MVEKCDICSSPYDSRDVECGNCYRMYREDIDAGRIPPGISKEHFWFADWQHVRRMERDMKIKGCPTKAIADAVIKYAQNTEKTREGYGCTTNTLETVAQPEETEARNRNVRSKYVY